MKLVIQDVTCYGGGHDCAEHINNGTPYQQRGSTNTGACVHDLVVNQLSSKIDGVNLLNEVLVIGMTSRKELLHDALLRAGLEVHIEIGLPDKEEDNRYLEYTHEVFVTMVF